MIEITHTIDKMKPFLSLNSAFIKINDLINENILSNENGLRYIAP